MKKVAVFLFAEVISLMLMNAILSEPCRAEDYSIAPADVLEISIWGEPDLIRNQLVVRPDGKVSFPLVGDLDVAGKTTTEVRDMVEKSIKPYVPNASATVIVSQLGSLQFYIIGKVARPGMYNVTKNLDVIQALSLAGGLTTFAKESDILVVRHQGNDCTRFPFNYDQVKHGKKLDQNIVLQRGDTIVVP